MLWLAVSCVVGAVLCLVGFIAVVESGRGVADDTHTVEIYHGNWWTTWHTPGQIRFQTGCIIGSVLFLAGTAVACLSA